MISVIVAVVLAATQPCRADGHNQHRSERAKATFRHLQPCPGGPNKGSTKVCKGYVIDHICPLACCGRDEPINMQWQTARDSKAKDKWELSCSRSCRQEVLRRKP